MSRDIKEQGYEEWSEHAADQYVQAQRRAFLDGFETAAKEAEAFQLLRQWLRDERDEAARRYKESDDIDWLGRKIAFQNVLVQLSKMGVRGDETG